ncbi:MAG: SipW-dependent-type signal peptide-containing protein [Clostridia bacterium]|nr:SipW-dependent-type signal peptide-containing protein [Clostridia bacterium]
MNKRKILSLALGLCMVAILAVGGTLAYFTDTDTQTNTFTAGKVGINLDEAVVKADENDNLVADGDKRTEDAQSYKLHPNMTITKDPTITVDADSDNAYVAAVVTVKGNIYDLIGVEGYDNIDITKLASGGLVSETSEQKTDWNGLSMVYETENSVIYQVADKANNTWTLYVFVKPEKVAGAKTVLFDTLTIPESWNNTEMALINNMTIKVDAYAAQVDGFADCFDAMTTAFDTVFAF